MKSIIRVRYFCNWNYNEPAILFSADSCSVNKLQNLFQQFASRQIERAELNSLDFIQAYFDTNIVATVGEKDIGIVKLGDVFEWSVSPSKWKEYAELLSVIQDAKKGHQYLDVQGYLNSIEIQVSVNEYSSEWIGWKEE